MMTSNESFKDNLFCCGEVHGCTIQVPLGTFIISNYEGKSGNVTSKPCVLLRKKKSSSIIILTSVYGVFLPCNFIITLLLFWNEL